MILLPTLTSVRNIQHLIVSLDDFFELNVEEEDNGSKRLNSVVCFVATLLNYSTVMSCKTVISIDIENRHFWSNAVNKLEELFFSNKRKILNYPEDLLEELKNAMSLPNC